MFPQNTTFSICFFLSHFLKIDTLPYKLNQGGSSPYFVVNIQNIPKYFKVFIYILKYPHIFVHIHKH